MDQPERPKYLEVEGVETTNIEDFPYSALKALGGIQLGLGVACMVLGIIDLSLYLFFDDNSTLDGDAALMSLTISTTPLWCGLWYCVTGCMAACMTKKNKSNLSYFKMTFLVLSILCSALFGPVCCIINIIIAVLRHELQSDSYRWMVPILVAFFAFNEIVFSIASASLCCCCAPIKTTKVRVLLATQNEEAQMYDVSKKPLVREKTNESLEIFTTSDRQGKPLRPSEDYRPNTKDSSYFHLKRLALPSSSFPTTKEENALDKF